MKKTNFQFYATHDEIRRFLDNAICTENVHVYLVRLYPEYTAMEVKHNQRYALNQWTFAIFSECNCEIHTYEEYSAYSKTTHGDLIMYPGEETETELKESLIGAAADHSINPAWIKLIGHLKKSCMKGAYVATLQNSRKYYPQIRYSEGAQAAYRNGKTIRPVAGWNRVELVSI